MIDRQSCYSALFKLKEAGIDISAQLKVMEQESGIPRKVIEFLRDNSPQFQFYRYLQKHQKALAKNILDYNTLDNNDKMIVCSSFITRVYIAIKYKCLDKSLVDELGVKEVSNCLNKSLVYDDISYVDKVMMKHSDSLRYFYLNNKEVGS